MMTWQTSLLLLHLSCPFSSPCMRSVLMSDQHHRAHAALITENEEQTVRNVVTYAKTYNLAVLCLCCSTGMPSSTFFAWLSALSTASLTIFP